ncbi:hypothetical protein N7468_000483 [Penicillium chermesinum]|uniref:Uncharacterized protein n=1 Tax=Penicillium chermesinum TaxID=63820 RepID=A0A9W9PKE4_9EURO|nr:uncharacterized protein N7468_000483 [Penicillium chermesinum]KAJ5249032.1 hypothetical protein N7468_000483 [Penicillium chermesinum]
MIVYFQLCFQDIFTGRRNQKTNNIMSLRDAVSQVLELSLKLYRSRPRLMARISWPLFIAGIATSDRIYQDWVSIRLRELGRYGQNYARMSEKYDEVIRAGAPNIHRVISTVLGS